MTRTWLLLLLLALCLSCLQVNAQETTTNATTTTTNATTNQTTPIKCEANQIYNPCGSACPANCSQPNSPAVCTRECKAGCVCKDGYVLDGMEMCVPKESCMDCPGNSTYFSCGSSCPPRCDTSPDNARVCAAVCASGCACKRGYVRVSEKDGQCVLPENCPKQNTKTNKQY